MCKKPQDVTSSVGHLDLSEREQQKGMIQAKKSIKLASRDSRVYSACIQDHLGDGVNPNNCDYKKVTDSRQEAE